MTELAHRTMVALTPQDVPSAQTEIAEWCKAKVLELSRELREARQNLRQAKAMKWKHLPWQRVAQRLAQRIVYYVKIRKAVDEGYLIVPNFDVEVMAVRVQREKPPEKVSTYKYSNQLHDAKPELLPPGVGRYVDDKHFTEDRSYDTPDPKNPGKSIEHRQYVPIGYDEPDFPVMGVKPVILEATGRAMALNLFDQIGVVTGKKKDPVVVGEIFDPTDRYRSKRVTFFIAWWLDTKAL